MNPIPTPYDITDIPIFPFSPGLILWSTAILILLTVVALLWRSGKRQYSVKPDPALRQTEIELNRLLESSLSPREVLARGSLLLRRFVSHRTYTDIAAFTSSELKRLQVQLEGDPVQPLLRQILLIEQARFSPSRQETSLPLLKEAQGLIRSLDASDGG